MQPTLIQVLRDKGKFGDKYAYEEDEEWNSHDSDSILSDIDSQKSDESDESGGSETTCCCYRTPEKNDAELSKVVEELEQQDRQEPREQPDASLEHRSSKPREKVIN